MLLQSTALPSPPCLPILAGHGLIDSWKKSPSLWNCNVVMFFSFPIKTRPRWPTQWQDCVFRSSWRNEDRCSPSQSNLDTLLFTASKDCTVCPHKWEKQYRGSEWTYESENFKKFIGMYVVLILLGIDTCIEYSLHLPQGLRSSLSAGYLLLSYRR